MGLADVGESGASGIDTSTVGSSCDASLDTPSGISGATLALTGSVEDSTDTVSDGPL